MELNGPPWVAGPAACGYSHRPSSPAIRRAAGAAAGPPFGVTRNLVLVSFILFLLFADAVLACPMCKEAAQDPKLTEGFARSIQLMLLAPYIVFGGLAFTIVRSAQKNRQRGQTPPGPKGV